jgi:prolipoprotein diacylglyceryltransferase
MIPDYGVLVAGGIAVGALVSWSLAPRLEVSRNALMDVIFWAVVGGVIGARLLYVGVQWEYFFDLCTNPTELLPAGLPCGDGQACYPGQECDGQWCQIVGDCWAAVKFWQGGWVFLGGVLGGIAAGATAARLNGVGVARGLALMSVGLPLGHLFGRIGCHYQGCCFGKYSEHAIAVGGRLPTQLVEAGCEVLIFAAMLLFFIRISGDARRRDRKLSAFELSAVPVLFLTLYSPMRFVTELFRGDELRGFVMRIPWPSLARLLGFGEREPVFFSTSQLISALLFVVAAGYWTVHLMKRPGRR